MRLRGTALHYGGEASVDLEAHDGPIVWCLAGREVEASSLVVLRTDRGVTVGTDDGEARVDLAEHLLSAIGGLGIRRGLKIRVDDPELPLLDGGARDFARALLALGLERDPEPSIVVDAVFDFRQGDSVYRFSPHHGIELSVEVDFPPPVGRQAAAWFGDPARFVDDIAPARTFGWLSEADALRRAGRAHGAMPGSVVVLTPTGSIGPGPEPTECARHKLLDLIGDVTFFGGPPRGRIHAYRPGHTATHLALREGFARGALVPAAPRVS